MNRSLSRNVTRPRWGALALIAAASALCGCAGTHQDEGVAMAKPAIPLAEHDGYRGRWLRSKAVELFVGVEPNFRILAMRRPGEKSMMASASAAQCGVRLAFMDPDQQPHSFDTALTPAAFEAVSEHTATVQLPEAGGVTYRVTITVDPDAPRATMAYRLTNVADQTRDLAAWSVVSFTKTGLIVAPLDGPEPTLRRLVIPRWSPIHHPAMIEGKQAVAFDMDHDGPDAAYKIGLASESGWLAMVRGRDALVTTAPRIADAVYPEGDANLTVFYFDRPEDTWCELEQVGPLRTLKPGEALNASNTLQLIELPDVPRKPDALREAIESGMR